MVIPLMRMENTAMRVWRFLALVVIVDPLRPDCKDWGIQWSTSGGGCGWFCHSPGRHTDSSARTFRAATKRSKIERDWS